MKAILAALLAGVCAAAGPEYAAYRSERGAFRCELPKAWTLHSEKERDSKEKVYAVLASAPEAGDGLAASVGVEYYSPGNRYFRSADEYLRYERRSDRRPSPAGPEMGPVQSVMVGAYPAKRFRRTSSDSLKEYVLIPRKTGFFILRYWASKDSFARHKPNFDRMVRTFSTTVP